MNASKIATLLFPVILVAGAGSARAIDGDRDGAPVPVSTLTRAEVMADLRMNDNPLDGAPIPGSTLSRAEVLADLQVWHESGMAAMASGEAGADPFSEPYRTAQASYHALRASPRFARLVAQIARQRGEVLDIAMH